MTATTFRPFDVKIETPRIVRRQGLLARRSRQRSRVVSVNCSGRRRDTGSAYRCDFTPASCYHVPKFGGVGQASGVKMRIRRNLDTKRLSAIPTATGGISRLAYARARETGIELRPLLKKAGLTREQIEDRGARVNVHHQIQFLNLTADALKDEFLGFHLGQSCDLRELGLLYYVTASSETLGHALQRAARYSSITNEGLSLKYLQARDIRIVFNYVGVARHLDQHQIEFCMTALIRLCRQLTGVRLLPSWVKFTHRRSNACSELAACFGGNIEFSARTDEMAFALTVNNLTLVYADPYLNELLVAICEKAVSRRPAIRGPARSAVENAIVPLLPHGQARAGEIARRLGMSRRTFARRLSLEGVTFLEVLEGLRKDLARQYLADQDLSISRIAWLLGYQEISAFTHAFKRWTGKTPRHARQLPA
jgi:AraC-like DNA-binding protein